jgi:streptogramin lyase
LKPYSIYCLVLCSFFIFTGCKKNNGGGNPVPNPPTISTISPDSGPGNTIVTISGNNFGTDISKIKVFFNGLSATVQSVTNIQVVAKVPPKANTGIVKIEVNSQSANGPIFNYIFSATVSTLAGNGQQGFVDGTGSAARFNHPLGVTVDSLGNVYVADDQNLSIRKITASGVVSTLAGNPASGSAFEDGDGSAAKFGSTQSISFDPTNTNLYVGDPFNNRVRKITLTGTLAVSTYAGGFTQSFADGNLSTALFNKPNYLAVDAQSNIYVTDFSNERIRKISAVGIVSTLAGNGTQGTTDGAATGATVSHPLGIAVDAQGNVYFSESNNSSIRKITAGGVSTLAGGAQEGFADGSGSAAMFASPAGVVVDSQGNIYVADSDNHCIRKITSSGVVSTLAGGPGQDGFIDGKGSDARFSEPYGITIDTKGDLYVADRINNAIRKITRE